MMKNAIRKFGKRKRDMYNKRVKHEISMKKPRGNKTLRR